MSTVDHHLSTVMAEAVLHSSPESSPDLPFVSRFPNSRLHASTTQPSAVHKLSTLAGRAAARRASGDLPLAAAPAVVKLVPGSRRPGHRVPLSLASSTTPASSFMSVHPTTDPSSSSESSHGICPRSSHRVFAVPPMSASLPPSPPDSPSVFNWSLPSPGLVSPLSAYETLTPTTLRRAPWTEIVFPASSTSSVGYERADTPPLSDDESSEEGSCDTPTESSFASAQLKFKGGGGAGEKKEKEASRWSIPRIEVLPVPSRRAPLPPVAGKAAAPGLLGAGAAVAPRSSASASLLNVPGLERRRSAPPSLEEITKRLSASCSSPSFPSRVAPSPQRRATCPGPTTTTTSSSSTTGESRLPPFLLARRLAAAAKEVVPAAVVVEAPVEDAFRVIPTFTVTPPPERDEGSRRMRAVLGLAEARPLWV